MLDDKIRDTLAEELRAAVMTNAAAIALATFDEAEMDNLELMVADKVIEESGSFKPPSCLARNDLNMVDPPNYWGP